jgi:cell wall-associated NlpC family hydrolase
MRIRTAALLATSGLLGFMTGHNSTEVPKTETKTQNHTKEYNEGPIYSETVVPPMMCSRYVRLAAHDLFGINYPQADAWNLRSKNDIEEIPINNNLEELVKAGKVKPGMIIGTYNPTSKYNDVAKKAGAGYTHVLIYIGNEDGKLIFADKFGKKTRSKLTLEELKNSHLEPREALYLNNRNY